MTVVALLARPPTADVLPGLTDADLISHDEAADLYEAMLADAMRTIELSGGDLLVNFDPGDDEQETVAALRTVAANALDDPDTARFEPQVGSSKASVVGNTITHLLEEEDATTAAVLRPEAPLVTRSLIDSAAMQLRRNEVVLGPATEGRVYYAGFREPIDFENALTPPAVDTLATRGADAGLDVEFEQQLPLIETNAELRSTVALLQARQQAGRVVPIATTNALDDLGLVATSGESGLELTRH